MKMACIAFLALGFMSTSVAQNNGLPSQIESAALLTVISDKGVDCEQLKPWQGVAIRALVHQDTSRWTAEQRASALKEVDRLNNKISCDTPAMTAWIEGSRKGFDTEMLPPYLVAYRHLASMQTPPDVFAGTALRLDYSSAINAIDAKLEALEAAGVTPEGGKPWPQYIARTEGFVDGFVQTLNDTEANSEERNQAATWLAQTGLLIELWLSEES